MASVFRKLATLAGVDPTGRSNVKFKSPALNKFIDVRTKAKNAIGGVALSLAGVGALKKVEGTKIADAAKRFAASDAGGAMLNAVEKSKIQVSANSGADTSGVSASYKLIEWLKKNFVWVIGAVILIMVAPIIWGFMKKSKRIPSRRKPISKPAKRTSYRGKSTSTRAKQLAALARGRAKRLRNLRAKKR